MDWEVDPYIRCATRGSIDLAWPDGVVLEFSAGG